MSDLETAVPVSGLVCVAGSPLLSVEVDALGFSTGEVL